jgi:threonine aldolase
MVRAGPWLTPGDRQDDAVTNPAQLHDPDRRGFASDNNAGVHPDLLAAIVAANGGHQLAYGADVYTARLGEVIADHFGEGAEAFPVFNGTGANVVSLQSMLPRWGAVVCAATAHIHTDENAAPERVAGLKLLTVETPDGKLTPDLIDRQAWGWGDEHRAQPLAVSITQATELGTTYTAEEVRDIADHVHALGMRLHMDGARLANAAASLGVPLRALTRDAGVDVLSFGGTKNGLLYGECIVVLDRDASEGLHYLRKLTMQLASKMRFVSAQFIALLNDDLWLRNAAQANAMATRLRSSLESAIEAGTVTDVSFTQLTQTNAVFAVLPRDVAGRLREEFPFYDWNPSTGEVRWMCSYDTTETDVDRFVACLIGQIAAQPDQDP